MPSRRGAVGAMAARAHSWAWPIADGQWPGRPAGVDKERGTQATVGYAQEFPHPQESTVESGLFAELQDGLRADSRCCSLSLSFFLPKSAAHTHFRSRCGRPSGDGGSHEVRDCAVAAGRMLVEGHTEDLQLRIARMAKSVGRARPKIAHTQCDQAERLQDGKAQHGWRRAGVPEEGEQNCEQKGRKRSTVRTWALIRTRPAGGSGARQTPWGSRGTAFGCVRFRMQICRAVLYILIL